MYTVLTLVTMAAALGADSAADAPTGAAAAAPAERLPRLAPAPPPPSAQIDAALTKGIEFLLRTQHKQGWWGSATSTKDLNIFAPVPGSHQAFRAAVTAMCISALLESGGGRSDVAAAVDRAEAWLFENLPKVRRADGVAIYNVWTHCYAIQALVRMDRRKPDDAPRRERIKQLLAQQFDLLGRYESVDGGWGYYDFRFQTAKPSSDSISFVNAAVLVAFHEARQAGFAPPQKLVDRAVAATKRQHLPDDSYLYGEYLKWRPRAPINRPGGSLGRTLACHAALRFWGETKIADQALREALDRLFARNGWLDIGRKRPIPHESWFQVAGYFYYFGHYYAAYCIEMLPADQRGEYRAHMARVMLARQEKDGSWWDYPFYAYHQPYGTAFALMTLVRAK